MGRRAQYGGDGGAILRSYLLTADRLVRPAMFWKTEQHISNIEYSHIAEMLEEN